jgi:AraC-like DNA-binding protein
MENAGPIALYAAAAGAAVLASFQMALRSPTTKAYQAAAGFFAALGLLAGLNAAGLVAKEMDPFAIVLSGAMLGALAPSLWLYVDDLVADVAQEWGWRDWLHFAPALAMAVLAILVAIVSMTEPAALAPDSPPTLIGAVISWAVLGLTMLILLMGVAYIVRILGRFAKLRSRLKQVFSDSNRQELLWLQAVTGLFILNGVLTLLDNVGLMSVSELTFAVSGLAFTLIMGGWAVRQIPAFQLEASHPERAGLPDPGDSAVAPKYERSKLDDERLGRIAARIDAVCAAEQLHLDPNLSLRKLSSATGVSEINLSQTFSRLLNTNFFEYVNARRVEEAKALLLASDHSVLQIAIDAGFNSRSAFYSAFKESTGLTPVGYRKSGTAHPQSALSSDA